jgi:hypothetical protein
MQHQIDPGLSGKALVEGNEVMLQYAQSRPDPQWIYEQDA